MTFAFSASFSANFPFGSFNAMTFFSMWWAESPYIFWFYGKGGNELRERTAGIRTEKKCVGEMVLGNNISLSRTLLLILLAIYSLSFFLHHHHRTTVVSAMKVVIQRVKSASVSVVDENVIISSIGPGILALVGLHVDDTISDLQYCAKRLLNIKLWESSSSASESGEQPTMTKPWRRHVRQLDYEILCVSQFTLYGTVSNTKYQPDYKLAMKTEQARSMYSNFLDILREGYPSADNCKIKDGAFGKMMDVALVNDGPVTLVIDSREENQRNGEKNEVELSI
jgi:D-tyrosyl-tRNA(Tyr) deacylase